MDCRKWRRTANIARILSLVVSCTNWASLHEGITFCSSEQSCARPPSPPALMRAEAAKKDIPKHVSRPVTRRREGLLLSMSPALACVSAGLGAHAEQAEWSVVQKPVESYPVLLENLRQALDWYRFDVGDLVALSDSDRERAQAMRLVAALLAPDAVASRAQTGEKPLSKLDREIVRPMLVIVFGGVLSLDLSEEAARRVGDFRALVTRLQRASLDGDGPGCQRSYVLSLRQLNTFFSISNEGFGAQLNDPLRLRRVPLNDAQLERSEYWKHRRHEYLQQSQDQRMRSLGPVDANAVSLGTHRQPMLSRSYIA